MKICQPFICLWGVKVKQRFVLNLFRLSANRLMYLFQWKYVLSGHYFSIWWNCLPRNRSIWLLMSFRSSITSMNRYIAICKTFGIPIGRNLRWIWLYRVPFIRWCRKYFRTIKSPCSVELIISLNCLLLIWLHWKRLSLITIPITAMMICLPSILLQGGFRNMLNCFVTTPNWV